MKLTIFKNKKWISYILFGLAGVMAILTVLTYLQIKSCEPKSQAVDTVEDGWKYLKENSNLFDVLEEQKDFWPEETLVLDFKQKCVIHTTPTLSDTIKYENINNACKKLTDQTSKNNFRIIPDKFDALIKDSIIESEINAYISTYKQADIDTVLRFSRLYNVLAGDSLGHIILGVKDGKWKLFRKEDFPSKYLTTNSQFYNNLIKHHQDNPNEPLSAYLNSHDLLDSCAIYTVYYDVRHSQVIEQDNKKVKENGTLMHRLDTLKVFSGWLNYKVKDKEDKRIWQLQAAQTYYLDSHKYFVSFPENWTEKVEWKKSNLPAWLIIVFGVLAFILLGLGGGLLKINYSGKVPQEDDEKEKEDNSDISPKEETCEVKKDLSIPLTISAGKAVELVTSNDESKKIVSLEKQIKEIEEELKKAKSKISDLEKEKVENKSEHQKAIAKLEDQHKDNINKLNKTHAEDIKKAEKDAVERYQRDNKIEVIGEKAANWDELLKINKSDKLLQRLEELRKKYPQFAQIETMRSTYQKAAQNSKDYREQVLFIFRELREQVDKNLQWENTFSQLCTDADYANKVRDRFEAVRKQVDTMQRNQALVKITQKGSLDFLERVALCTWSLSAMNDLLAAFQCKSLPTAVVSKTQNDVASNLLQLFVARVFMEEFAKNSSLETFVQKRQTEVASRIDKLAKEYGISVALDKSLQDTNAAFDNAMDQIRGTDEYVNRMWKYFVEEFDKNASKNTDKAWFFGMMVAMGYHTVDFVRRKHGEDKDFCYNYKYLLSDFSKSELPSDSAFAYQDFAHSVDYSNRVYEWLSEMNVKEMKALVGRHLILP